MAFNRRYKMNKKKSRRSFSRSASYTHKKNVAPNPLRGGIRL